MDATTEQVGLFPEFSLTSRARFSLQLLKWVGNKQRVADQIISFFPKEFGTYYEPFLGSGGVLASLAPARGVASDSFAPLMEIWFALKDAPERLKEWYTVRWDRLARGGRTQVYEEIRDAYNQRPNGGDLLFLCRACYGGVVRFRKDGVMSTPCGVHAPITPAAFARRVDEWHHRVSGTQFVLADFEPVMQRAERGDLVYCDPPYACSQTILYGAQSFSLSRLLQAIEACKQRGVHVALSIDGTKKSGTHTCALALPVGLFEHEVFVNCGRCMLRRFQMNGQTLEAEGVADRLLMTY